MQDYQKININIEWFNNNKHKLITIKCPTIQLLTKTTDIICYLLALNIYPKFQPNKTIQSYILENGQTGYLTICGNNYETIGHTNFKFTKGE
ncbi:hypothetical protein [Spiroplasma endosymbiont of Thecophora atra]|uniref:hypothetical protein n=1 Tax=Spiroplasma endosymbiont of Thecophora atra TaxID=3066294 RepID=UPI0030D4E863